MAICDRKEQTTKNISNLAHATALFLCPDIYVWGDTLFGRLEPSQRRIMSRRATPCVVVVLVYNPGGPAHQPKKIKSEF